MIKNIIEYLLGFLKDAEICEFLAEYLEAVNLSLAEFMPP